MKYLDQIGILIGQTLTFYGV